jgi:multiple sugar transport system permease protein
MTTQSLPSSGGFTIPIKDVRPPRLVRWRPYLIIAPAMLLLIGIIVPFALAVYYSFTNYKLTQINTRFIGLGNYQAMLSDADFLHSTLVTLGYAIGATSVELLIGLGIALMLNRDTRLTKVLQTTLIFPMMIAPVIGALIWKMMMQPSVGILNPLMKLIGLPTLEWASVPETALPSVILIDVWIFTPFVALILLAGLRSFPREPFEAARVDGASMWFTFRNLTLPMLTPFMIICIVFRFMDSLKMFDVIYAMTGGGPGNSLMTYQLTAYYDGFIYMRLAQGLPYALVLYIVIYIISQILVKYWGKAQRRAAGY